MAEYQQLNDPMTGKPSGTVLRRRDFAYIPDDMANRDRQIYVEWCEAGNTPDPPEPPPVVQAAPSGPPGPFTPGAGAAPVLVQRIEALEARMLRIEQALRT